MKSIILLLSFMSISNVFSVEKNVGDRSTYVMNFQGMEVITENIVTDLNRSSDEYDVKTITKVGGQIQVTIEKVPTEDLMTKEIAVSIIDNCSFMGGVLETIHLVGAARETCKLEVNSDTVLPLLAKSGLKLTDNSNGFIWIGAFPINGIGRMITQDLDMTLTSMNW